MNVTALYAEIRYVGKTDSTSFPDADILVGINLHIAEVIQDILRVQTERNTTGTTVKYDLINTTGLAEGSTGYNGEYPFPTDLLRPIRLEVSYDGVSYKPASVYDMAGNDNSEQDQTDNTFPGSGGDPAVRFMRDSFFIRPLHASTTVSNGIIVWYEQRQAALTSGSETPPFESNFHEILVFKGLLRYAQRYPEKYNPLWTQKLMEIQLAMKEFYKNRFKKNKRLTPSYESFA